MSACADVRVCSKETRFSVKEVDIGIAADIGVLSRLPKLVANQSWVKEVCLSARIFGAEEALAMGLVSHVYETKAKSIEAAVQWASLVASKSPVAVQGTKELLNHARDHSVAESRKPTACTRRYSVLANVFRQVYDTRPFGTRRCSRLPTSRLPLSRAWRKRSRALRSYRKKDGPFYRCSQRHSLKAQL